METTGENEVNGENAVTISNSKHQLAELPTELCLDIYSFLPVRDIITCERVSKRFKRLSKKCLRDNAQDIEKENPLYTPGGGELSVDPEMLGHYLIKRELVRTGNALAFLAFTYAPFCSSGRWTFWVVKSHGIDGKSDTLYWTTKPRQKTKLTSQVGKPIPMARLWPNGPAPVTIHDITCNEHGMVLARLEGSRHIETFCRDVVFAPFDSDESQIRWRRDYGVAWEQQAEKPPCLLGKSSIYVAEPPEEDGMYRINAYGTEQGSFLWTSDESYSWRQCHPSRVRGPGPDPTRPRVIRLACNEELILGCPISKQEDLTEQVDIIWGSSGLYFQSIRYPGLGLGAVLTNPITRQMAIIEEVWLNQSYPWDLSDVFREYRVVAIRHFLFKPNTGLSPFHTDMVITPRMDQSSIAINPFFMTAVCANQNTADWVVQVFQLVKAEDPALREHCAKVLSAYLPQDKYGTTTHEYFILGGSSSVNTFSPGHKKQGLVKLKATEYEIDAEIDGEGNAIFRGRMNSYIVKFF